MKHDIPHDLDMAMAKKVTDRAFAEYRGRFPSYDPSLKWANDTRADISITAMGMTLAGAMHIDAKKITLELDVPFLMRPFQKKAVEVIEGEVKMWIGKAKAGEL